MFSSSIINDYINQLESLKRDGKENSKESLDILDKFIGINTTLNISFLDNLDINNSWLLNLIGKYYKENKDYPKAIEWYTKSANLGNSDSMNNLGIYYDEIEENYIKAIEWYIKSANLGDSKAMNNLGYYYNEIEENYIKALDWYIKSANLNDSDGMNNLGIYYYEIEKDYQKAIYWFTKSANLGNIDAMFNLGNYYYDIEKDYPKAIEWWIKSANLGNTTAMNNLKIIKINEKDYDYVNNYVINIEGTENEKIKDILLSKLPTKYVYNKMLTENNHLKSIKTFGIDKVMVSQIAKFY